MLPERSRTVKKNPAPGSGRTVAESRLESTALTVVVRRDKRFATDVTLEELAQLFSTGYQLVGRPLRMAQ